MERIASEGRLSSMRRSGLSTLNVNGDDPQAIPHNLETLAMVHRHRTSDDTGRNPRICGVSGPSAHQVQHRTRKISRQRQYSCA